MHLPIDATRAKSMARTLKTFLEADGKGRFAHVNALEATARMLGYRNHNAMLATLEATRAPVIKALGDAPRKPRRLTVVPYGLIDVLTGEHEDACGEVEIDLARTLSEPAMRAALAAAIDRGDAKVSPRLLQGQPEIDALIAGLPVSDTGDIDSCAWLDFGMWADDFDDTAGQPLGLDEDRSENALSLIDDADARNMIGRIGAARHPEPVEGDARVVANPVAPRDPDDAMRGRPDWEHRVVVYRDGAWHDMAGVDSAGAALEVARAFAGQPAPEPTRMPEDDRWNPHAERFPLDFRLRETPAFSQDADQAIGTVEINGAAHHITLFRVADEPTTDADGDEILEQQPTSPVHLGRYEALQAFENVDRSFRTLPAEHGAYICVITPYCR